MQIAILGTGAMGCLVGGYLSRCGDVTLLTHRPEQAEAVNREGLRVITDEGTLDFKTVKAVLSGTAAGQTDLLIVFVKAFQTVSALRDNASLIRPDTAVLTLQNGIGNADSLASFVPAERILIGTTTINSRRASDTAAEQHGGMGVTTIGSASGNSELAGRVCELFVRSGFDAAVSGNIEGLVWKKVFVNLTINPLTALFNRNIGLVEDDPNAWAIGQREIAEAVQVANAAGQRFDCDEICRFAAGVIHGAREGTTSMRTDILAGRPTEIGYINGAVAALGKKYGVPTPCNAMMADLIRVLEGVSGCR